MRLASFYKLYGASGFVNITAPFPSAEASESPFMLVAITLAQTLDPHGSKKGSALNVAIGTLHVVAATIAAFEPSQSVKSVAYVVKSLLRISIL